MRRISSGSGPVSCGCLQGSGHRQEWQEWKISGGREEKLSWCSSSAASACTRFSSAYAKHKYLGIQGVLSQVCPENGPIRYTFSKMCNIRMLSSKGSTGKAK